MGTLRLTYGMITPVPAALYKGYNLEQFAEYADPDLSLTSAWAVSARWRGAPALSILFAAAYKMSGGEFMRLTPRRSFSLSHGGWGAWELAGRLASIDLNDGSVTGGDEMVWTTALNWYLNPAVRLMFEWSRIVDTDGSSALRRDADGMDIFQGRVQFVY